MSQYEELCQAFFETEPSMVAIDKMLRELPANMRSALSTYLAAPIDKRPIISSSARYVDLYTPQGDTRALCNEESSLIKAGDGMYIFCIGIYMERNHMERNPNILSVNSHIIYINFTVTDFDENVAELMLKNCNEKIKIANTRERSEYIGAAQQVVSAILTSLKMPPKTRHIGFLGFS